MIVKMKMEKDKVKKQHEVLSGQLKVVFFSGQR